MKVLGTYLASLAGEAEMRRNLRSLLRLVLFVFLVVVVFAIGFHVIMARVEGQQHSWLTGFYWALTVMTTLGFGDITFSSDLGRAFSILVLLTGVLLLLIVLPFAFIRFFYAPWLEANLRMRAPRVVPDSVTGHVVFSGWDSLAQATAERLAAERIPHYVLEPDQRLAVDLHQDGVPVINGSADDRDALVRARVAHASLVVANRDDVHNTNVTLTVRDVSPTVRIVAMADQPDSVDILELSGASRVIPLKQRLGEQMAVRANAGRHRAQIIGHLGELYLAEFSAHGTPLVGRTVAESQLRETTGVSVVAVWDRARLAMATPATLFTDRSVPVVAGSVQMIADLDEYLARAEPNPNFVLVIGGGKVGRAATRELRDRGVTVHLIEKKPELVERIGDLPHRLFLGDAARRELIEEAGVLTAPTVLLTTNDDAVNVFLTVYCRRLQPEIMIVSRISHARNMDSIHRAGADLILGQSHLGAELVISVLEGRDTVVLGEGAEMFEQTTPPALAGRTLAEAGIRKRCGLTVVAVQTNTGVRVSPPPDTVLAQGDRLDMIGDPKSLKRFIDAFGKEFNA